MIVEVSKDLTDVRWMSRVFRALGDENRLAILRLLRKRCGPSCEVSEPAARRTVSEIAEEFDLALSTVSHHLKELRDSGLVVCEKRGKRVHCHVNEEALEIVAAFLRGSAEGPLSRRSQ